jgi:hypothetical protein
MSPKSLLAWRLESLRLSVFGWLAASERVAAGMLNTDQCLNIPDGASGSSTTMAIERVPAGTSDHLSGGDVFAPSQVNSTGISDPSSKATDDISSVAISDDSGSNGIDSSSPLQAATSNREANAATATIRDDREMV